ncbi:uncharacterized protein LOC141878876 [Acropora palmata]|uniref:uncharacterized protein LOC141878876 n=1 Tax=Acropora palmata TaxID=6131 RepID=UPI003DA12673
MNSKEQLVRSAFESYPAVRYRVRKLNFVSFYYKKLGAKSQFDDNLGPGQKEDEERSRPRKRHFDVDRSWTQYGKLSGEENARLGLRDREPARQHVTVKTAPQDQQQVQQAEDFHQLAKLVRSINSPDEKTRQEPGYHGDQKGIKIVQRRAAVCDNIERQLVNENGISLRKLRKYLIVGNNLQELNLV